MKYHNVTNCPEANPFFDGKKCITCVAPSLIFNIFSKKCESCPPDSFINNDLRICESVPHYTNFTSVTNYGLDGADKIPDFNASLTPCKK